MRHGTRLPGGASHGTDLGFRTVTKQRDFKRRVRERMQKTGESYTIARLQLLKTVPDAREEVVPVRGAPPPIRFRDRRVSRRTRGRVGLRYVAPSFGIVIALAAGVVGFLTLTADHSSGGGSPYVTEGQP